MLKSEIKSNTFFFSASRSARYVPYNSPLLVIMLMNKSPYRLFLSIKYRFLIVRRKLTIEAGVN